MKVLFVVSRLDWAFHNNATNIARFAPPTWEVQVCTAQEAKGSWNVVVVMYWPQLQDVLSRVKTNRVIVGFAGYASWDGISREEILRRIQGAHAAYGISSDSFQALSRFITDRPLFLCPNGYPEFFKPQVLPKPFTVGWIGSTSRPPSFKGIDLIEKAAGIAGVPLVMDDAQKRGFHKHEHALDFYKKISCYICASESEGGPNPVIESFATGRAVISTRVGVVPEILTPHVNGLFIERNVESIVKAIQMIQKWNLYARQPHFASAIANRTWQQRSVAWYNMIRWIATSR